MGAPVGNFQQEGDGRAVTSGATCQPNSDPSEAASAAGPRSDGAEARRAAPSATAGKSFGFWAEKRDKGPEGCSDVRRNEAAPETAIAGPSSVISCSSGANALAKDHSHTDASIFSKPGREFLPHRPWSLSL